MSDETDQPAAEPARAVSYSEKYAGRTERFPGMPEQLSPYGGSPRAPQRAGLILVVGLVAVLLLATAGVTTLALREGGGATPTTSQQPALGRPHTAGHAPARVHATKHSAAPARHHRTHHSAPPTIAPATGALVENGQAHVSLRLPKGWNGTSLENGPAAAAHARRWRLRPREPDVQLPRAAPRAALLIGVDLQRADAGDGVTPNVDVVADPTVSSAASLREAADAEAAGVARLFEVTGRSSVNLGGTPAERIDYHNSAGTVFGAAYILQSHSGTYYALVYTAGRTYTHLDTVADSSAATFTS